MQKFIVIVTNEILGNSRHEMTLDQIKKFNLCAYRLAIKSAKTMGKSIQTECGLFEPHND